jgi:cytochrome c oxidase assembly protein subunit 15
LHSYIEYGNRLITGLLIVVTGVSFLAAWWRTPRRRDLLIFTGALVLGIVADALLGAIVVYSKLNPWLVSLHLLLSLATVAVATALYHRATHAYGNGAAAVVRDPRYRNVARWLWVPFVMTVVAGTLTTGSGPHSGGSQKQLVARRLPIAFSNAAAFHSVAAMIFVAAVVGLLVATWRTATPEAIRVGVFRLATVAVLQAALGYTQYWLHVPVLLVELHVFGAVALTIGVMQFSLRQVARAHERVATPFE